MGQMPNWLFRLVAPLRSRLSKKQYLALHLLLGFIVTVASLWAFIAITEAVLHQDRLTGIDTAFANWLHSQITRRATSVFKGISFLGSPQVVGTVGAVAAIALLIERQWGRALGLLAAFVGTGAINWAIKVVVRRPRPEYSFANVHDASFSFPSGHAMGSLVAYGILAYLLISSRTPNLRARRAVIAATATLVLAIGVSRLYLEVHYLSDVIGGYLAGVIWLLVCISGIELSRLENRPR